jgi:NAD(P)-dependent dehydrogenase (short-subunit alcohol dehydrogenase family)
VAAAIGRFGRIDVLVNNAGFAQLGTFETISNADVRAQFDTNVFGTMNVTRAVLPGMRAQRSGRIFNISSVAGYIGGTHYPVYAASKFAVEGFSESLAAEVSPFGIFVTLVEPGFFRTDFLTTSVRYGANSIDDYRAATIDNLAELDAHHREAAGDPAKFADVLLTLSRTPNPPVRCTIGTDAIAAIERTNAAVQAEIDRWRDLCSLPADMVLTNADE